MKLISFTAGLGNQLFQYCFYCYLSSNFPNENIYGYYNKRWLENHGGVLIDRFFDVRLPITSKWINLLGLYLRILNKCFGSGISKDDDFYINRTMFVGYWQDKHYFKGIDISYKKELVISEKNKECLEKILMCNSVAVHFRRGDYMLPKFQKVFGSICTVDYYQKSISKMSAQISEPVFFVFSDDIDWVKQNFIFDKVYFVDWNKGQDSFWDMYLMSQCSANIIANSTFSFWGAYLNKNNPIVIYPKNWIRTNLEHPDIFPEKWIGL